MQQANKALKNRPPEPNEDEEQMALFEWARLQCGRWPELALMHHIPNGGKRSKTEAARFKEMGVKAGVPDIFLPAAKGGHHGLYIELKRQRGGKVSERQKEWAEALSKQGYRVIICHGWPAAAEAILEYLKMDKEKPRQQLGGAL